MEVTKDLEQIIENYKSLNNRDLSNVLLTIESDFDIVKGQLLALTETIKELEIAYEVIYNELQARLKFKDVK